MGAVTRLKIWLVALGVFALGGVTGALLNSAYRLKANGNDRQAERRPHSQEKVFNEMKRELNLTDQQATEIRTILDQTRNDYHALRTEVRPRYDALRQNARARIRALLTQEQQQKFDTRVAERDARRGEGDKDDH